jgi:hypothetical protein
MFEYIYAHKYTSWNRKVLQQSELCGCIGCRAIYPASEISQWHQEDENGVEQTAICARCNVDGVIPDKAGYLLTNDFLMKMHNYWMEPVKKYSPTELVEESTIDYLNKWYLRPKGFRIEIENEPKPNRNYLVYEGAEELYKTNNPKELLIKIAQLLPDSDVHIETQDISVGEERISQDTLKIHIHYQIPE